VSSRPAEPEGNEGLLRIRPPLQGSLVRLRPREEDDLPGLKELFNDPDVLAGLMATFPQPLQGIRDWMNATRADRNAIYFVIEGPDGEPVGVCSLESVDERARSAELGIWVGKPFWGRGFGTDATRVLCRFGFAHMNLQRITLHVYETNPRARRVYERIGFVHEGTLRRDQFLGGRYIDVHVMGLLAEDLVEG
jgi:RimJ/RimL family protein N-acetyltransferase